MKKYIIELSVAGDCAIYDTLEEAKESSRTDDIILEVDVVKQIRVVAYTEYKEESYSG